MMFRQWINESKAQDAADRVAQVFQTGQDIDTVFDGIARQLGLSKAEEDEAVKLVKAEIDAGRIVLHKSYFDKTIPAAQRATILELFRRSPRWLAALKHEDWVGDDHDLDQANDYMWEKFGVQVRDDGLIDFRTKSGAVGRVIGDLPVAVYHVTSDNLARRVKKKGLAPSNEVKKKVFTHGNSQSGVYVMNAGDTSLFNFYGRQAMSAHKGRNSVIVTIRTTLKELQDDPDDADIESGKYQFILPRVLPSAIVNIE
jgi:hypothetical protein